MRRNTLWLLASAGVLAACGGGGGGGGGSLPQPSTGSFQLINSSSVPIDEVLVSPSTSTTWGDPRNAAPIPSGSSWALHGLAPGQYDAAAVVLGTASFYISDVYGFSVAAGQTYSFTATDGSFSGSLKIKNGNATYSLSEIYVVPTGSSAWGPNRVTTAVLPSNTFHIVNVPPGGYDIRCVRSDGYDQSYTGLAVSSLAVTYVTCS